MSKSLIAFTPDQTRLIRRAIPTASKLADAEFDLFIELCRLRGLNPITRQVYPFLFHEADPKKRQMVLVVSIDGQRAIAARTGNYRPDPKAPRVKTDKRTAKPDINPYGVISATVAAQAYVHGEWSPAEMTVYWEEFAPIIEVWAEDPKTGKRAPTGKYRLDPAKQGWIKSGRHMLAKVAEMQSLRKAFPDAFGGLYAEEETHASESLATQLVEEAERTDRLERLGGPGYIIDWLDGEGMQKVPHGRIVDATLAYVRKHSADPATLVSWAHQNRVSLNELWAQDAASAFEIRTAIETAKQAKIEAGIDTSEIPY